MTTRLPLDACPFCGHVCNAHDAGPAGPAGVTEGDGSLCLKCGSLAVFDAQLRLRRPTLQETAEFMAEPEAQAMVRALAAHLRSGRAPDA